MAQDAREIGAVRELIFEGEGDFDLLAFSWSVNSKELIYLLDHYLVNEKGWLSVPAVEFLENGRRYVVSPTGHEFLENRRHRNAESMNGFCAMWFNAEVSDLWQDGISKAIQDAGYSPVRIDEVQHVNRIDDEIVAQIRRSKFVVADFTGNRGGVYFEAGFALGLGLPVIWTIRHDELSKVHFDNRQYNFLVWDQDEIPALRKSLTDRIVALLGEGPLVSGGQGL